MPVRPEYLQGAGIMQGGLIVALADEAIAHAMMTQLNPEEDLTTIELKSNFLSSVAEGKLIADPDGHLKIPHPWPGQNPPPAGRQNGG